MSGPHPYSPEAEAAARDVCQNCGSRNRIDDRFGEAQINNAYCGGCGWTWGRPRKWLPFAEWKKRRESNKPVRR